MDAIDISDDFKGYKRKLILLRPNVALMMHLFYRTGTDNLESAFLQENDKYLKADYNVYEKSAKQFIKTT